MSFVLVEELYSKVGPPFPIHFIALPLLKAAFPSQERCRCLKKRLFLLCHQDEMRVCRFHPLDCQDSLNFSLCPAPISTAKTVVNIYSLRLYTLTLCPFCCHQNNINTSKQKSVEDCVLALGPERGGKTM